MGHNMVEPISPNAVDLDLNSPEVVISVETLQAFSRDNFGDLTIPTESELIGMNLYVPGSGGAKVTPQISPDDMNSGAVRENVAGVPSSAQIDETNDKSGQFNTSSDGEVDAMGRQSEG